MTPRHSLPPTTVETHDDGTVSVSTTATADGYWNLRINGSEALSVWPTGSPARVTPGALAGPYTAEFWADGGNNHWRQVSATSDTFRVSGF